jgi:polysaccharide export outer membrane protein
MNVSRFTKWSTLLGLLVIGLGIAGCQTGGDGAFADVSGAANHNATPPAAAVAPAPQAQPVASATGSPAAPAAGLTADSAAHLLNVGDQLTIVYTDTPTPIPSFEGPIKDDGTITLIFNKTFKAAGKTVAELEKAIHDNYVPAYYRNLTITVRYQAQTQFYYVGGEVRSPGRQVYIGRITVSKAIQSAGDLTDWAKKTKVQLTRGNGAKPIVVDLNEALKDPGKDPEVYPGDRIHVPRKFL